VKKATIHVVNLPKGTKVTSPEDAHKGEQKFTLQDRDVDMIGFFSTEH
jgi:acetolactate decarboxylase